MSERNSSRAVTKLSGASRFFAWTVLCFIVLSFLLSWIHRDRAKPELLWQIRAGVLRDVVREYPIGRQALVSSLWVMPLPALCALPFTPLLEPGTYGLAYLYGLALIMSLSTLPLAGLLRHVHIPLSKPLAVALLASCAYALGETPYSDLLACLACLITAVFFDTHKEPVLRALAGVFYGLALLAHPVGGIVAAAKAIGILADRLIARKDLARRGVQWIQLVGAAYMFGIFLFLNWMIMRSPLWPLTHFDWRVPELCGQQVSDELAAALARDYPLSAPVVSGHWGYVVEPILKRTRGHHFVDFHRDKVPRWERRELVLVLPKKSNPLVSLSALAARMHRNPAMVTGYLPLSETPNWEFYLVVRPER